MALNSYPPPDSDGLTAVERLRTAFRDELSRQLPDLGEDEAHSIAAALADQIRCWIPRVPVSITYAWSNGQVYSVIDQPGGIPDDARERAILRGLLTHTLQQLEKADLESPLESAVLG